MADFEGLNERRLQTLREMREMVGEETALWARYFNGQNVSEMIAVITQHRARFREIWDQHERTRQQMVDAGFMPPPVPFEHSLGVLAEDPIRHKIEDALKAELEAARAAYYSARKEFELLVAHGTGLPAPDGNLRAKQVAAAHSEALRKYTAKTRRFSAFLTDGKLPEE